TKEWEALLRAADVPHAPVWSYADLFSHPQAVARGLRTRVNDPTGKPVDLLGSPFHVDGGTLPAASVPPRLGQDTEAVLSELLGLDPTQVGELRTKGIV